MKLRTLMGIMVMLITLTTYAQNNDGLTYSLEDPKFNITGYYRFLGYHRNVNDFFGDPSKERVVNQLNDGNISPTLNVDVSFSPLPQTTVGTEIMIFSPMEGVGFNENQFLLNRHGMRLYGNTKTKHGTFKAKVGGAHFVRFSDYVLGSATQTRTSLFERNPWSQVFPANRQYGQYYNTGSYQRDVIWGKRSVNGLVFEAKGLPWNMDATFVYGKTPFNFPNSIPDNIIGMDVHKKAGLRDFHVMGLHSFGKSSSVNGQHFGNSVASIKYADNINLWLIDAEIAGSGYEVAGKERVYGSAMKLRIKPAKSLLGFPFDLEIYRNGTEFSNIHGALINSSVQETQVVFDGQNIPDGSRPFGAVMAPLHLSTTNRTGAIFNTDFSLWKFKLNYGHSVSRDLSSELPNFAFYHKTTGMFYSHVDPFNPVSGPYGQNRSFFQGMFENVSVSDTTAEGKLNGTRNYAVSLVNLKFSTEIFGKPLYLFYLGEYQSVGTSFSPVPQMNDEAYIHTHFHEFDLYQGITSRFALVGYLGIERVLGNEHTDKGENGLPRDQTGVVRGGGFDYNITKASCIYFRLRQVTMSDKNFALNEYAGLEGTLELKVQF